jgi:hypothetical protein
VTLNIWNVYKPHAAALESRYKVFWVSETKFNRAKEKRLMDLTRKAATRRRKSHGLGYSWE